MTTPLQWLRERGQGPWVDHIIRGSIGSGALRELIGEGIRGLTANPTIFQKAVSGSADYDDLVRAGGPGASSTKIYERLIGEDIRPVLAPSYHAVATPVAFCAPPARRIPGYWASMRAL